MHLGVQLLGVDRHHCEDCASLRYLDLLIGFCEVERTEVDGLFIQYRSISVTTERLPVRVLSTPVSPVDVGLGRETVTNLDRPSIRYPVCRSIRELVTYNPSTERRRKSVLYSSRSHTT